VVEHRFQTRQNFDFSSISILDKKTKYMDHMIKEAIKLHPSSFNRDGDFTLSWFWYSVTNIMKQCEISSSQGSEYEAVLRSTNLEARPS
jgi:hypothetical protein